MRRQRNMCQLKNSEISRQRSKHNGGKQSARSEFKTLVIKKVDEVREKFNKEISIKRILKS